MSKGIFVKIDGELKKVKNVWTKENDVLIDKIVPKGLLGGIVREFISYASDWLVETNAITSFYRRGSIFIDDGIVILTFETNSLPNILKIGVFKLSDGSLIRMVNTPENYKVYDVNLQYWYEDKKLYYVSGYKELNILSVDVMNGEYSVVRKESVFENTQNTNIAKNNNLLFYTYKLTSGTIYSNNHNRVYDIVENKYSYENSGYQILKILPYNNYFIGVYRRSGGGFSITQYKNFKLTNDSYTSTSPIYISPDADYITRAPSFDIDNELGLCFVYSYTRKLIKIDLETFSKVTEFQTPSSGNYPTLSLDKVNKLIYISHTGTNVVNVYDYDFNLIKSITTEISSSADRIVSVDGLGLIIGSIYKTQRILNKEV